MTHRWTLPLRLTVVYGSLFFLAGIVVLGVTYVLRALAHGGKVSAVPREGGPAVTVTLPA